MAGLLPENGVREHSAMTAVDKGAMGGRIRDRRERLGLTQRGLGAALQVSAQAVSKWELGDSVPDVDLVLEQGDPLEVLVTRLRRQPPDLLALSSRGQLGRQSPITEALLAEPHCDIMLCRAW